MSLLGRALLDPLAQRLSDWIVRITKADPDHARIVAARVRALEQRGMPWRRFMGGAVLALHVLLIPCWAGVPFDLIKDTSAVVLLFLRWLVGFFLVFIAGTIGASTSASTLLTTETLPDLYLAGIQPGSLFAGLETARVRRFVKWPILIFLADTAAFILIGFVRPDASPLSVLPFFVVGFVESARLMRFGAMGTVSGIIAAVDGLVLGAVKSAGAFFHVAPGAMFAYVMETIAIFVTFSFQFGRAATESHALFIAVLIFYVIGALVLYYAIVIATRRRIRYAAQRSARAFEMLRQNVEASHELGKRGGIIAG